MGSTTTHTHTHTHKFFIRPIIKVREREKRPQSLLKKGRGCFFRAQRKEKKKRKRRNEHTNVSNKLLFQKKNRVKVARAPSTSSIRTTRGNRRGFVLDEEEGEEEEGEEERDGRESFWWGRGRSRANRK